MPKALIVGDSQAQGTPGRYAEQKLRAAGYQTMRISNPGKGAIDYVNTPALWQAYTDAARSFNPDVVVLIFGSNDFGSRLEPALERMKNAVRAPVWMSGPPLYPEAGRQRLGEQIREANRAVFGSRWIDAWPHTPLSLPRDHLQAHLPGESGRPWGEAIAAAVMSGGGGVSLGPQMAPVAKAAAVGAGVVLLVVAVHALLGSRRVRSNRRRRRGRR